MSSSASLPPVAPPSTGTSAPASLPVLGRGKHRNPSRGACFMEYTSVLAGEPFSDSPRCVDRELAAVLRSANDTLSDADRPALVPFLGRAIGLVAPAPAPAPGGRRFLRRLSAAEISRSSALTMRLRRSVLDRFLAAVGVTPSAPLWTWYRRHTSVSHLFWELMGEPGTLGNSPAYVERLVSRVGLLHECYEEAMVELGLRPPAPERRPDAEAPSPSVPASA